MKGKLILATAAAVALVVPSLSAYGADFGVPPVKAPVEVYNWTGVYAGGNFGYSWGKADSTFVNTPAGPGATTVSTSSLSGVDGALGGVQFGFNWQNNSQWVWGVEVDFQGTDQRKSFFNIDRNPADIFAATGNTTGAIVSNLDQKLEWFGTVRGRIGAVLVDPRWMIYGTGGFAYGQVKTNLISVDPDGDAVAATWTETRTGWVAGAGVEAALWGGWSWKVEYLHLDLGRNGSSTNAPLVGAGGPFLPVGTVVANIAINTHFTDEIVRIGANYRFFTH